MVAGKCNCSAHSVQQLRKRFVLLVAQLVAVGFSVAARFVRIRRVAVEQGLRRIITEDDFGGGHVLNLHTLESLDDFGKSLDAAKPPGNRPRHPSARRENAMSPTSLRTGLR